MACMKLKKLEEYLQDIEVFENPKVMLEQYATMPHIGARMLHTIQANFGDIENKLVGDLGCGCGSLTIGAALLGAQMCIGFDIDPDALSVCKENIEGFEIANIDTVLCDVTKPFPGNFYQSFDCIIMNPPFGTKSKGLDVEFLKLGLKLSNHSVYSLHKTSTRKFIVDKAESLGAKAQVLAQLSFDLPATYKFHKKNCVNIDVDFIRFEIL